MQLFAKFLLSDSMLGIIGPSMPLRSLEYSGKIDAIKIVTLLGSGGRLEGARRKLSAGTQ